MKILLIQPEVPKESPFGKVLTPPIGLMYIAAVLENNGFDVAILDNNLLELSEQQLSKRIKEENPDLVGISLDCIRLYSSLAIANSVKTIFQDQVLVVMGGPHVNVRYDRVIQYPDVDFVVYGEGEYTMLELCEAIAKNKPKDSIRGLGFKENGKIRINPPRPLIENLDELPFPALHLVPVTKYPRKGEFSGNIPVGQVSTSRGCPFNCAFCSNTYVWGRKYRYRSAENVLEEIKIHVEKYGAKGIYFREDCLTINRKRVIDICEGIKKEGLDIKLDCESRVDTIDRELLKIMREAGCENLWFGVESGNQKTLDMMNKGITLEQTKTAFKWCKEVGIKTGASIMLGIPYETIEDMKRTIQFVKEINATYVMTNIFMGIPISKMYYEIIENNWIDSNYGDMLYVKTDNFSREEVEQFSRTFVVRELSLNLRGILKVLHSSKIPKDIPRLIKGGVSLLLRRG